MTSILPKLNQYVAIVVRKISGIAIIMVRPKINKKVESRYIGNAE